MAETIDYKVRIDTSSLADQLQQVKNQVDQAMATYTFRTAMPDPQPQAYAFPEAQFQSGIGVSAGQAVDTGRQMVQQDLNNLYQSTRLGFHKFSQDAMNLALTSQLGVPPQISNYAELNMPSFNNHGFLSQGAAGFGKGYDPHMSLSLGAYQRYARNAFSDNAFSSLMSGVGRGMESAVSLASMASPVLNFLGATSMGAATAGVASLLGPAALAYEIGAPDFEAYLNMRGAARDTSWRFLSGRFSNREAGDIANKATWYGRGEETIGRRMTIGDVQETMKSYTEAGGFDFIHNSREFSEALKTIVESIARGSEALRMSRDEYSRWHAQMNNMGLVSTTQNALGLQTAVAGAALGAGYTAQELTQFGMQTAEMVRGTGISMGSAFVGGIDLLAGLKGSARGGYISKELIQQLGGFENAGSTMARIGYQFGQSSAGLTALAAESYYGPGFVAGGATQTDAMMGAIARINSPQAYLEMRGTQAARLSNKAPEELFMDQMAWQMQTLYRAMGSNQKLTEEQWVGYANNLGYDNATARLGWNTTTRGPSSRLAQIEAETALQIAENTPGIFKQAVDVVQNGLAGLAYITGVSTAGKGYAEAGDRLYRGAANYWNQWTNGYELVDAIGTRGARSSYQVGATLQKTGVQNALVIAQLADKAHADFSYSTTSEHLAAGIAIADKDVKAAEEFRTKFGLMGKTSDEAGKAILGNSEAQKALNDLIRNKLGNKGYTVASEYTDLASIYSKALGAAPELQKTMDAAWGDRIPILESAARQKEFVQATDAKALQQRIASDQNMGQIRAAMDKITQQSDKDATKAATETPADDDRRIVERLDKLYRLWNRPNGVTTVRIVK